MRRLFFVTRPRALKDLAFGSDLLAQDIFLMAPMVLIKIDPIGPLSASAQKP